MNRTESAGFVLSRCRYSQATRTLVVSGLLTAVIRFQALVTNEFLNRIDPLRSVGQSG